MLRNRHHQRKAGWLFGLLAAVLLSLTPWLGEAFSQGRARQSEVTIQQSPVQRGRVVVQEGRLSVNLWNAQVTEVFTQIERQARITILIGPTDQRTVSAQFSDIALERGLRRLLRLASLNYSILYTRKRDGSVGMKEVRVFAPDKEAPSQSLVVERDVEKGVDGVNIEEARQRYIAALARGQASSPRTVEKDSEGARRFREALERAREQAPEPAGEQESEAIRRFREALEQTRPRG